MVQLDAGGFYTIGLKKDGTVVAVGENGNHQLDVGDWSDIVQIAAGDHHTVGLKKDGTIMVVGYIPYVGRSTIDGWAADVTQIAAGTSHTVGLRSNGAVVATGGGLWTRGELAVGAWSDIVQVVGGYAHTVGLKEDGAVVATGLNEDGQCGFYDWNLFPDSASEIEVSLDAYNFGKVGRRETSSTTVTILNTGKKTLIISDIFLNNDRTAFEIDATRSFPLSLAPGESVDVDIAFTPPHRQDLYRNDHNRKQCRRQAVN